MCSGSRLHSLWGPRACARARIEVEHWVIDPCRTRTRVRRAHEDALRGSLTAARNIEVHEDREGHENLIGIRVLREFRVLRGIDKHSTRADAQAIVTSFIARCLVALSRDSGSRTAAAAAAAATADPLASDVVRSRRHTARRHRPGGRSRKYRAVARRHAGRSRGTDHAHETRDIWIYDAKTGERTRFTSEPADENWLIWSADGTRVVLNSFAADRLELFEAPARSIDPHTTLLKDPVAKWPVSWSRDGRFVLFVTNSPATSNDIWVLPLTGDRQPYPYLRTEASENWAAFSPDGKWVAFSSTVSGQIEVYVRGSRQRDSAGACRPTAEARRAGVATGARSSTWLPIEK